MKYIILAAVLWIDVQFCYREIWIHLLCCENGKTYKTHKVSLYMRATSNHPSGEKKKDSCMVHEYMVTSAALKLEWDNEIIWTD